MSNKKSEIKNLVKLDFIAIYLVNELLKWNFLLYRGL